MFWYHSCDIYTSHRVEYYEDIKDRIYDYDSDMKKLIDEETWDDYFLISYMRREYVFL